MKLTCPKLSKLIWLFNSSGFKSSPLKTILRLIGWEYHRIFNKAILAKFDRSLQLWLYPNDGVGRLTYYFGYHEPEIFRFLDNYICDGMVFLDVGANIGAYSLFAAKRVSPGGKVYAFEPQHETFARLIHNIELNEFDNIIAEHCAVGCTEGEVEIVKDSDTAKSYVKSFALLEGDNQLERCPVATIDGCLGHGSVERVDYLKIDVEGVEYNVLKGGENFIKKHVPSIIQVELFDDLLCRSGSSVAKVCELLEIFGYRCYELSEKQIKLVPIPFGQQSSGDTFWIHKSRRGELREFII